MLTLKCQTCYGMGEIPTGWGATCLCLNCDGNGYIESEIIIECPNCEGAGEIQRSWGYSNQCEVCQGVGLI